jgi:copper chaperone
MESVTLKVEGMTCPGCVASVTRVLQSVEGVSAAQVTLQPGEANVSYDASKTSVAQLKAAIEEAGYDIAA